jgi:hypothetical protein
VSRRHGVSRPGEGIKAGRDRQLGSLHGRRISAQARRADPGEGARHAIDRPEVLKHGKVIYATEPKAKDVSFQFNDTGEVSTRHYYYVRLQQDDRMTAWSSPLFVNY